jgi:hypothetical protein
MHCFPQCIRPIHSAHQKEPRPNTRAARRRTSSVRRQFAARRSCSPEQPPLAASLPAKEAGVLVGAPTMRFLTGSSVAQRPQSPSALSFLLSRVITPAQTGRDCLAAYDVSQTHCERRIRAFARNTARLPPSSTQATLPHYGVSRHIALGECRSATRTWPTRPGAGLLFR